MLQTEIAVEFAEPFTDWEIFSYQQLALVRRSFDTYSSPRNRFDEWGIVNDRYIGVQNVADIVKDYVCNCIL